MPIRAATRADAPRFLELVHELARYEKLTGPTPDAEARLVEDAFGPRRRFDLYLAEDETDGVVVGYAVVFETYSTFRAAPLLYLEDLYVTPGARRFGVGRAFLRFLAQEALRRGCARLAWVVLDWNEPAIRFYDALGAKSARDWLPYQLEGEALARVAAGES
jgi:GNAT superfamily N-acetyltransferase